jgi:glycosyltransferase involved in cell wall biosynthesis
MFIEKLTPLILTYNEAANIGRTLKRLEWARDIVVVDSISQDETLRIVADFPQARVFQRRFDTHVNQWNFGMQETGIATDWVLALDAGTGRRVTEARPGAGRVRLPHEVHLLCRGQAA